MKTVSVVIVNWNAIELLPTCLASLDNQVGVDLLDVIVVDNHSEDDSVDWLESHTNSYGFKLKVIANSTNAGFGVANNQGAQSARGEILVLLNPDTELVEHTCLATLANALDDESIGLVGPRLSNPDGSRQRSCASFPSIPNSLALSTGAHKLLPKRLKKRFTPGEWEQNESSLVDWLGGACMVFRCSDFSKIGGFSESTFMYGEDLEIAFDIHKLDLGALFLVDAEVIHHDNYSANKRWQTSERAARVAEAELVFLRRNYPAARRITIRFINLIGLSARWALYSMLRDDRSKVFGAMVRVYLRSK